MNKVGKAMQKKHKKRQERLKDKKREMMKLSAEKKQSRKRKV